MRQLSYVIFLILIPFVQCIKAQESSLKFLHYNKSDGLNQSSVNALLQDSWGTLWIANFGGINSFDGYTFRSYVNDFKDTTSIADNAVWDIYQDNKDNIWLGTKSGLSLYNRKADNFINYFIQKPGTNTLAVKTVYQTQKGRLLVGSEGKGLYEFNPAVGKFIFQDQFPNDLKVTSIIEDREGNLWVGTENAGLYCLGINQDTPKHYFNENKIDLGTVWSLETDSDGHVWIGTDTEGLVVWEPQLQSFNKLSETNSSYKCGPRIKVIRKDKKRRIWIGSATMGLSIYDPILNKFYTYPHKDGDDNTPFDNNVSDICIGQNGVVWLGTYMNGFNKVIETPFHTIRHDPNFKNSLSHNNVYCTYRDREGYLWFGTFGGGLNRYDTENKIFLHYKHNPNDPNSISNDWVRILYEDSKGEFWVGTWGGGLNKLDRRTGRFKRYLPNQNSPKNSLNFNIITALYEDSHGNLWVGTYGRGINIYQPETDDFRSIKSNEHDQTSLSDDHITSFYEDAQGYLWVCTYGGGLNRYDYSTGKFKRFVPDKNNPFSLNDYKVLHIFPERDSSYYWITTLDGGLNKFYPEQNKFEAFTMKNGLPNNSILGMLRDDDGYWISTNNGLSHFNVSYNSFTNYTSADGLASDNYNLEAYVTDDKGLFYFGGSKGVTFFDPNEIRAENAFPQVRVVSAKVDGKPFPFAENSQTIVPYNKRVSFDFAAINPSKVANISYAYELEGLDHGWQYVGKKRFVEFTSLDPGGYTLKIKSTNGSKLWNEGFYSLDFYVPAPWYMTWYFRGGVLLSIIMLGVGYYYQRVNKLKEQKRSLEKIVAERTYTIVEKNQDLETSYQKLKRLEEFKESLFHMIAHDLKNPLLMILSKSDIHTQVDDMRCIHRSGQDMLRLIEDMLDVQKFEQDKMRLNIEEVPLNAMVAQALKDIQYFAQEKQVTVYDHIEDGLIVFADFELCARVMLNLLSNALKFSPFGSKIDIRAIVRKDRVNIEVQDHGEGIDQEAQKHIFKKYVQDKVRAHGKVKSTGLGLPFCKLVVEAHQGQINVRSKIDEGSTFYFDLGLKETRKGFLVNADNIKPNVGFNLSKNDLGLLRQNISRIDRLTIYETGEWYNVIEQLEGNGSTVLQAWCKKLELVLLNFDTAALEEIKRSLKNEFALLPR